MGSDQGEGVWFRTDEALDVAGSTRHALLSLDLATTDPHAWKWVLVALHSALQGACVCHLTGTAQPVGALTDRNTQEWLNYLHNSRDDPNVTIPKVRLLALPSLLNKVRKPNTIGSGAQAPGIEISDEELRWLNRFHYQIRNQFIHFSPMGWTLELSGVPGLCVLIARIIGTVLDAGWGFRHLSNTDRDGLIRDIDRLAQVRSPDA